jgi:hypothetical protein
MVDFYREECYGLFLCRRNSLGSLGFREAAAGCPRQRRKLPGSHWGFHLVGSWTIARSWGNAEAALWAMAIRPKCPRLRMIGIQNFAGGAKAQVRLYRPLREETDLTRSYRA